MAIWWCKLTSQNRWKRLSEIVQLEINTLIAEKIKFEDQLDQIRSDFDKLSVYMEEIGAEDLTQAQVNSIDAIKSKRVFYDALNDASNVQNQLIHQKEKELDQILISIQSLFSKQKSYEFLQENQIKTETLKQDKIQSNNLDEIASQMVYKKSKKTD